MNIVLDDNIFAHTFLMEQTTIVFDEAHGGPVQIIIRKLSGCYERLQCITNEVSDTVIPFVIKEAEWKKKVV